jgi:hypothetical protein
MSIKEYKHLARVFCLLTRCNHDTDPPRRVHRKPSGWPVHIPCKVWMPVFSEVDVLLLASFHDKINAF